MYSSPVLFSCLFTSFKSSFVDLYWCQYRVGVTFYPHLLVCITNAFEVLANGRDGNLEFKTCVKLFLKFIKVGGAVSGDVGLNELDEAN